jgi:hypothetical protein
MKRLPPARSGGRRLGLVPKLRAQAALAARTCGRREYLNIETRGLPHPSRERLNQEQARSAEIRPTRFGEEPLLMPQESKVEQRNGP